MLNPPDVKKETEGKAEMQKGNPDQSQDEENVRKRLVELGYI